MSKEADLRVLNSMRCDMVFVVIDVTERRYGMLVRETDDRYCVHDLELRAEYRFHVSELERVEDFEWGMIPTIFINTRDKAEING